MCGGSVRLSLVGAGPDTRVAAGALLEVILAVGVVPLLAVVTLRQQLVGPAGTNSATIVALGNAQVACNTWMALVGQGLTCRANTFLLAYLLYRSGLVPRFIPALGLPGGPLALACISAASQRRSQGRSTP